MKNRSSPLLMSLCTVLLSMSLYGTDLDNEARIPAGERAVSTEMRLADRQESNALAEVDQEQEAALAAAKRLKCPAVTTHQGAYQTLKSATVYGDLELSDGSIWKVSSKDTFKILSWLNTDLLVITQNRNIFSSYSYKIVNQMTGAEVRVNMFLGPIYNSPLTRWIVAVDYTHRQIFLDDNSVWKMSWIEGGIIKRWMPNDTVIIGVNGGLCSKKNPNILINVNTLEYAVGASIY